MRDLTARQKYLIERMAEYTRSLAYALQTNNEPAVDKILDDLKFEVFLYDSKPQEFDEIYDIVHRS